MQFVLIGVAPAVHHDEHTVYARSDLLEQCQPFAAHRGFPIAEPGCVAAGTCQAPDNARVNRIADARKYNWNGSRLPLQFLHDWRARRPQQVSVRRHKFCCRRPNTIDTAAGDPAKFDTKIAPFRPTELAQTQHQSREAGLRYWIA